MNIKPLHHNLQGPLLIEFDVFKDLRGSFTEVYNQEAFERLCLPNKFVQTNVSVSNPNVLRGMHFQEGQGKFVTCVKGKIYDVMVDVRKNSNTRGDYTSILLEEGDGKAVWIPDGFAHGFCVIGNKEAYVMYQLTKRYNKYTEKGLAYNDPNIGINWPGSNFILSDKDKHNKSFKELF